MNTPHASYPIDRSCSTLKRKRAAPNRDSIEIIQAAALNFAEQAFVDISSEDVSAVLGQRTVVFEEIPGQQLEGKGVGCEMEKWMIGSSHSEVSSSSGMSRFGFE
jgi:hypothetical protein